MSPPPVVVPETCTLPNAEQPTRVADLETLFSAALRSTRVTPTRLDLVLDREHDTAEARALLGRESECCSFFTFTWTRPAGPEVLLTIEVPPSQVAVLDAIEG